MGTDEKDGRVFATGEIERPWEAVPYRRDWDSEYLEGAHWDSPNPSGKLRDFIKLLTGNESILDAGCGGGRDAIHLARLGFKVTGMDISTEAIRIAKERSKETPGIGFVKGRLEATPFPDKSFGAIYSGYVLQRTRLSKSISELYRLLKPNGTLYVVMFIETSYDKPNSKDLYIPEELILSELRKVNLFLFGKSIDRYQEIDRDGTHYHTRMIFNARNCPQEKTFNIPYEINYNRKLIITAGVATAAVSLIAGRLLGKYSQRNSVQRFSLRRFAGLLSSFIVH